MRVGAKALREGQSSNKESQNQQMHSPFSTASGCESSGLYNNKNNMDRTCFR